MGHKVEPDVQNPTCTFATLWAYHHGTKFLSHLVITMHSKLYKQLPYKYNLTIITRSYHLAHISYIHSKYEHKK